uniref:Capping protein regulator and myosin 1 linker 2 n=1 Tax=Amphiprion percula TaxID=161767 RepID=A0A3P8TWV6_AMPPE
LMQIVLETDRQTLSFSVLHADDLEAMISHMTASLKRIFPDSSPRKLLKTIPFDLQERLLTLTDVIEQQLECQPGCCGGFSDTYAALCDFNEMPFREEIQWDVDNIYYIHNWRQFNLQDFSHLDSRDLALAVAALSFNQWFTKICCKELKLSVDVQQQLTFLLSRSPSLQELSLEASGLKLDFAVKMAAALREHTSSTLQSINLSGNPIEDKGLGHLSQVLSSSQLFTVSLTHLDLSCNPGSLVTEEAMFLFKFLSSTNSLSHLDLSDTNCPLDTLFVSLSAGCCYKLMHLNLARNPFSHRKVREVTRSIQQFFSQSCELKYVGLSATKLPPQALRLLLQGLATNTRLFGLELDLSSCELHSAGAQVIQEHISEATAIRRLDISDNSFENDMVTLVLSVGRCQSLRHLALGRNFAMKSRALTDVLQRIAQLIQDEECPLQSLSVCDSKLKTGMHILLSALGGHATLAELDISGNNIGDNGAKMLAKALMSNTRLRTLTWDRNNVSAKGFQDVADALERNFTLQQVFMPLADITQSYRSNPDKTKEALNKSDGVDLQPQVSKTQQSEKLIQGMCRQLEDSLQRLSQCNMQEAQADILTAHEVLQNARDSFKAGWNCASDANLVNSILADTATALTNEFTRSLQEMAQDLMRHAEVVCPQVDQRSSVFECLLECVSKRSRQTHIFMKSTLVEDAGHIISKHLCNTQRITIPELLLVDSDFPTDDYSPAFWRNGLHSTNLRPAPSIKSKTQAPLTYPEMEREVAAVDAAEAISGARGASFIPPPSLPLLYSIPAHAPNEGAVGRGGLHRRETPFPGCGLSPGHLPGSGSPVSPMEPLPTQGQTLRHYTASRPRPRRTHTQPPSSRPQEPVSKVENEASEVMGRVDEGVEEFFTKKIIADYALGAYSSTPFSSSSDIITSSTTVTCPSIASTDTSFASNDVPPLLTSSPPPTSSSVTTTTTTFPTKNIKKKFGDFFAFKRARPGRATKAGGGEGGGGEGVKVKRTSIADLIRPLREAKERERERERDKEKEKERGGRSVEDANISNDATTTEGSITLTTLTPPDLTTAMLSSLDEDIVPVLPGYTPRPEISSPLTEQKMQLGGTPYGERRLKVTKRSLREGKSQSLILLTGLEPEDKDSTPSKKHASESTSGFEQRLQVMLHRMGVAKTSPAETKMCQNKDEELRKANSEGAILDKPEPPATYMKPRTMSTSSESLPKPRQHIKSIPQRRAVSVHEDALSITQGEALPKEVMNLKIVEEV